VQTLRSPNLYTLEQHLFIYVYICRCKESHFVYLLNSFFLQLCISDDLTHIYVSFVGLFACIDIFLYVPCADCEQLPHLHTRTCVFSYIYASFLYIHSFFLQLCIYVLLTHLLVSSVGLFSCMDVFFCI